MTDSSNPRWLLQITDTHLFAPPDEAAESTRLANVDTRESLAAVLDMALAQRTPDVLVVTGDIAQDPSTAAYAELRRQIRSRYSGELVCLPGNHDEPVRAPELFDRRLWRSDDWLLIALDSHVHGEERGELSTTELEWLADELAATDAQHILAAVHHPPLELASPLDHGRISNGRQLLEQLAADGRVRGILFGHVHQAVSLSIGPLTLLGTPSTCVQFKPLVCQFALDTQPPGCRWVKLSESGTLQSEVARLDVGQFPASLG